MTDRTDMAELLKHTRALRDMGCAVAVFTPEELRGADPDTVEDLMVQRGNEAIDYLADDEEA